jgi:hypothetical protein
MPYLPLRSPAGSTGLPSELTFGSFLVYSPKGSGEASILSQSVVRSIKADGAGPGNERMIDFAVRRLVEELERSATCLHPIFQHKPMLVPVPPSAPVLRGGLWIPKRICEALLAHGLGSRATPLLGRRYAIPKSAYAAQGKRPTVKVHEASLEVQGTRGLAAEPILLVDDVVTKGAALFGAAAALAALMPACDLAAFALVRTMGFVPDIDRLVSPCIGTIRMEPMTGDVHREP